MKLFILDTVASVIRFLLVVVGGWLATHAGIELTEGGLDTASIAQVIGGIVMAGLSFAMKQLDAMGGKGSIAKLLIGPRIDNIGHSSSRWIVGLIGGVLAGILPEQGLTGQEFGDTSIVEVVVLLAAFGYDRISKLIKP